LVVVETHNACRSHLRPTLVGVVGIRSLIEAGKISELILFHCEAPVSFRVPAALFIAQAAI